MNAHLKRQLLGDIHGTVLEIGAGHGANFDRFGPDIQWIGLEPKRRFHARLKETARRHGRAAAILCAPAESIPMDDASVDAVVSTVVLCSVDDQDRALTEIKRVLRPGGSFVFYEHVAAPPGSLKRRVQRLLAPLSRRLDNGCDPARDTEDAIRRADFDRLTVDKFAQPIGFGVAVPFIAGRAQR